MKRKNSYAVRIYWHEIVSKLETIMCSWPGAAHIVRVIEYLCVSLLQVPMPCCRFANVREDEMQVFTPTLM
jgi:hypothetical protein